MDHQIDVLEISDEMLIAETKQLQRRNNCSQTPLHVAAANGHYGVVRSILKSGGQARSIYCEDDAGNTPLHLAAGSGSTQILRAFHAWTKSNLDCVNGKSQTPLHFAASHGRLDAVKFLLDHGANKNACDEDGALPFHLAAKNGHDSIMEELIPDNESITILINKRISGLGLTALHLAAGNGHRSTVEWLLLYGADVNAKDSVDEDTSLHWALKGHSIDVIETLLKWGANKKEPNKHGKMPFNLVDLVKLNDSAKAISWAVGNLNDYFSQHPRRACASVFLNQDHTNLVINMLRQENPVHWADTGKLNAIQGHLQNSEWNCFEDTRNDFDFDIENNIELAKHYVGILVPELCIQRERLEPEPKSFYEHNKRRIRIRDIAFGIDTATATDLPQKLPPLYVALKTGEEFIAKFIQECDKMAVNKTDKIFQRTTLHWAVVWGETEIVAKLCRTKEFEQYMSPHLVDKFGKTAFGYALESGNEEILKELLEIKSLESMIERLYRDRQLYIDSANAILVGAALIASVTFASWLQPPLNNTTEPYKNHLEVRVFWAFNSLSFFFAIATVLTGAGVVLPMPKVDISTAVQIIRERMFYTALLLACSIIFVLGAFAAAGFAALLKHRANMIATVVVGGSLCTFTLGWYIFQLRELSPWGLLDILDILFLCCNILFLCRDIFYDIFYLCVPKLYRNCTRYVHARIRNEPCNTD